MPEGRRAHEPRLSERRQRGHPKRSGNVRTNARVEGSLTNRRTPAAAGCRAASLTSSGRAPRQAQPEKHVGDSQGVSVFPARGRFVAAASPAPSPARADCAPRPIVSTFVSAWVRSSALRAAVRRGAGEALARAPREAPVPAVDVPIPTDPLRAPAWRHSAPRRGSTGSPRRRPVRGGGRQPCRRARRAAGCRCGRGTRCRGSTPDR